MKIAVIGGTGLQEMSGVGLYAKHQIESGYADRSLEINELIVEGDNRFFFLPRHGAEQSIPPHRINYRANIHALSQLGVKAILAVTAVGGIRDGLAVGDLLVPDQLIDYTWGRESTFFDGEVDTADLKKTGLADMNGRRHIDFTYPYSANLRHALLRQSSRIGRAVHVDGTYACTQGPRLETAAEVRKLKADGADIVGMTSMPEAALARELDIDYASVSLIVNPGAGLVEEELSEEDIMAECLRAGEDISKLLLAVVKELQSDNP